MRSSRSCVSLVYGKEIVILTVSITHPNTSSRVCHENTFSGGNRGGSPAWRAPRRRPRSDPMLCDARKHGSPEGEDCGSAETASSTDIRVKNGFGGFPYVVEFSLFFLLFMSSREGGLNPVHRSAIYFRCSSSSTRSERTSTQQREHTMQRAQR